MPLIKYGYLLLARIYFESDLMNKPPLYTKLWFWMIFKAQFKDTKKYKRGQFLTSVKEMQKAMSHYAGYCKKTPTYREIRCAYEYFRKNLMIVTKKVTEGLLITICNYNKYQNPKNYINQSESQNEGTKTSNYIKNKNDNNYKNKYCDTNQNKSRKMQYNKRSINNANACRDFVDKLSAEMEDKK